MLIIECWSQLLADLLTLKKVSAFAFGFYVLAAVFVFNAWLCFSYFVA